jgi:hypothetical protein
VLLLAHRSGDALYYQDSTILCTALEKMLTNT